MKNPTASFCPIAAKRSGRVLQTQHWQSIDSLTASLRHLVRSGGRAVGPDGVSLEEMRSAGSHWLRQLHAKLRAGKYSPSRPRVCRIPKTNAPGEYRELGIYNLEDRVVATSIKNGLTPLAEPTLHDRSYAFRPQRSVSAGLHAITAWIRERCDAKSAGRFVAVAVDIEDCFGSVRHEKILASMAKMADRGTVETIRRFHLRDKARGAAPPCQRRVPAGLIQGNPLSPLLCNLVLTPFDRSMNSVDPTAASFRYADDILIVAANMSTATKSLASASSFLEAEGFRVKPAKVRFMKLSDHVDWLGMRIRICPRAVRRSPRISVQISPASVAAMKSRIDELVTGDSAACANDGARTKWSKGRSLLKTTHHNIHAWIAGYHGAENTHQVRDQLKRYAKMRISQKSRS